MPYHIIDVQTYSSMPVPCADPGCERPLPHNHSQDYAPTLCQQIVLRYKDEYCSVYIAKPASGTTIGVRLAYRQSHGQRNTRRSSSQKACCHPRTAPPGPTKAPRETAGISQRHKRRDPVDDNNIVETATQKRLRQREAVQHPPPHQTESVAAASELAIRTFWPEVPPDILHDVSKDVTGSQAGNLRAILAGYRTSWAGEHIPLDPDTAWPELLANAYGTAEVAALRLRSYERDEKDPDTGLPQTFINNYNRHIQGRYGGGE